MKYRVKRADRAASGAIPLTVGVFVYASKAYDYGLASDDTRNTGVEHISVTYNEDGGYPFFTIPKEDLEEIK